MAIYAPHNLYPGINPHLHSFLQQPNGGWSTFHAPHIVNLYAVINRALPIGYYATAEESLQIATYSPENLLIEFFEPDILVKQGQFPKPPPAPTAETIMSPTMTVPIQFHIAETETVTSVVIYKFVRQEGRIGDPVVRIELLSPTNKPRGRHYRDYMDGREKVLRTGLRMVELDYLNLQPPLLKEIPSYIERHNEAYPYHIIVTDPRPTIERGKADIYSFGVLDPLPLIRVPLEGEDTVTIDFGAAYERTFSESVLFPSIIDYAQTPVNFDSYTPADRERIRAHMAQIAAEHASEE